MDSHADRRDEKRQKKRYGMRVNNRAAFLAQSIIDRKAREAQEAKQQKG